MFPFSVKFKHKIKSISSIDERNILFKNISDILSKHYAHNISIDESELSFNTRFFETAWGINLDVLAPIDKGKFNILSQNESYYISYEFYMYRFMLLSLALSIIVGIVESSFIEGLNCFFILGFLNWITAVIRQWFLLTSIIKEQ